ncbi:5'-AMP-activated protein kinase, catalytic alpha subunit [Marchantia polymorpha subsp. ruderalis]|uniref:non-specific serine/threonine protein kinase n=2 Tax=Marchantia polymorpha TaxID=3197 RepID=A0A176VF60_MARPO|nr:hypothetical protein AXG93_4751s1340 [Marchantia polymorpha subsp. ruderalis]PTQ28558.1 hypothetical protein MARPO_0160s0010 [Marchantia polymorpha]BBN06438.1 hypothetical protein Mp_3g21150 [Marchantia polymorpha subsp. ruderalis]|eukprot:PTQ28558.1 hypothetical protein MARPO_0160s0010 [Marchantia polymorpha]
MEGGSGLGRGGTGPSASAEFYLPNYRLGKTLGIGSFGKVKVAEHALTGHKVAIKILNRRKIRAMDMEEKVRREIKILRLFMHPHIIRLYEVIDTPTDIFVVMEYVKSGELFDYIVEKGRLLEHEARRFFQQIVSGVEYCHRNMVVHRDLKPENLLLDSKWNVKIADFGLSNIMRDGHFLKTSCGSPNYAAPEVISGKLYAGPEVDVWSCGVILYALLCGSLPFDDENIPNLFKKIKGGIYTLPSHLSPGARDLIPRMLLVDPMKRVTIPEIRQHPWFQAHLPRYLAVPPPDTIQQAKRIDEDILLEVVRMGFDKIQLCDSLRNRLQNKATVAYYLMLDNRRRISNGYLGADFHEGRESQGSHMDAMVPSPMGRPAAPRFPPGAVNRHLSPSNLQGRVVAERKWALGLQSRAAPREIMMEVLKALHELEICWKKLGHYSVKCRWVPPHPAGASQACRSNSDSPMVSGSLSSLPNSPMLASSTLQPGGELERNASTEGSEETEDSQGGEEQNVVKFEVQLYKVREEKYLLDLQRVEGPYLLFLDLCASFLTELRIL